MLDISLSPRLCFTSEIIAGYSVSQSFGVTGPHICAIALDVPNVLVRTRPQTMEQRDYQTAKQLLTFSRIICMSMKVFGRSFDDGSDWWVHLSNYLCDHLESDCR